MRKLFALSLLALVALTGVAQAQDVILGQTVQNTGTITVPASSVLTAKTTPVTLISGTAGSTIYPLKMHFEKAPGAAYVLGSATQARIGWRAAKTLWNVGFPGGHWPLVGTVLSSAAGGSQIFLNPGVNTANVYTGLSGVGAEGEDLILWLDNDMTSGGEDWWFSIDYVVVPVSIIP